MRASLAGAEAMPAKAPTWMIRSSNSNGRVTVRRTASASSSARLMLVGGERQGDRELVAAEARDAPRRGPSSSASATDDRLAAAGRRSRSRAGR